MLRATVRSPTVNMQNTGWQVFILMQISYIGANIQPNVNDTDADVDLHPR